MTTDKQDLAAILAMLEELVTWKTFLRDASLKDAAEESIDKLKSIIAKMA